MTEKGRALFKMRPFRITGVEGLPDIHDPVIRRGNRMAADGGKAPLQGAPGSMRMPQVIPGCESEQACGECWQTREAFFCDIWLRLAAYR